MGAATAHELPHGRTLTVRAVTVGDVDGLAALYDGLDPDDRYRRFFSEFRPDRAFIERMTTAADRGGAELLAVVSTADGVETVVGEAGYELLPDGDGELAMVVSRAWRGWLGPHLLDALLRRAAVRGVANLRADVLVTNAPMLHLLCARGWALVPGRDWSVVRIVLSTTGTTPGWPMRRTCPRVLVEAPGGRSLAGVAAVSAGFEVLACPGPGGVADRCPALHGRRCPLVDGADVVVAFDPPDDEAWHRLARARPATHRGVRVLLERTGGDIEGVVERVRALLAEDASA